jgi:hypothetical protein
MTGTGLRYILAAFLAVFIPITASAEFTPEEASAVASMVEAGGNIRSAVDDLTAFAAEGQTDENFPALAQALTVLVEAAKVGPMITADLVNASFDGDTRTRAQRVDDARLMVSENEARCLEAAALFGQIGLNASELNEAAGLYGAFPGELSYLDHEYPSFPGLIGISPDGKNIHGDYDVALVD